MKTTNRVYCQVQRDHEGYLRMVVTTRTMGGPDIERAIIRSGIAFTDADVRVALDVLEASLVSMMQTFGGVAAPLF
jgi:hypothetical protein